MAAALGCFGVHRRRCLFLGTRSALRKGVAGRRLHMLCASGACWVQRARQDAGLSALASQLEAACTQEAAGRVRGAHQLTLAERQTPRGGPAAACSEAARAQGPAQAQSPNSQPQPLNLQPQASLTSALKTTHDATYSQTPQPWPPHLGP